MEACRLGHARTATLLLEHGANVHYQNKVHLSMFSLMLIDNDWHCSTSLANQLFGVQVLLVGQSVWKCY